MKICKAISAVSLSLLIGLASGAVNIRAQQTAPNSSRSVGVDASQTQRLEVLRSRLDTIKKSVQSAISAFKDKYKDDEKKKDDKTALDTPLARLRSLEKEVSSATNEVITLRGRLERSEKFDAGELDQLEATTAELQERSDKILIETAGERKAEYTVGTAREKKKKGKFLGIFGGGSDEYEELLGTVAPGRDRELFVFATKEVRKGRYEVGRLLFQTIITTYPDSPYLPMAKLAIADSFYIEGSTSNLIQAAGGYQDWLTFFPTHPLADLVLLKVAESEMRQIGRPDRDPSRARKAEQRLKALLQQFPKSSLRDATEQRLQQVQDNLGLHDLWVGNFYYKKSLEQKKTGIKGAQSRYREILQKYPNFGWLDEVLYKVANTYLVEEETDEAAKYFQRIVRDYPNSDYAERAKEQLALLGASIPEPSPERLNVMPPKNGGFWSNLSDEILGSYELTIDKNGVLMTRDFDKEKFDLIDSVIENQGDLPSDQIPKAYTNIKRNSVTENNITDEDRRKEDEKKNAKTGESRTKNNK